MATKIKDRDSDIKSQLAKELRIWLSQSKYGSQSQFSRTTGISLSNIKKYFQGVNLPADENLRKLQEATNLEILNQLPKSSRTKKKSKKRLPVKTQIVTPISPDLANEKAKGVWKTLVSLNNELEFFKRGRIIILHSIFRKFFFLIFAVKLQWSYMMFFIIFFNKDRFVVKTFGYLG